MAIKYLADGTFYLNDEGNLVEIVSDDWCESPRHDGFNMGTFYTWMRSYESPDKGRPDGFDELGELYGIHCEDSPAEFLNKFNKYVGVAMPVYAIDHSNVEYRCSLNNPFNDPWDSGFAGVIFATKERIREMYCIRRVTKKVRQRVIDEFVAEVAYYNDWANGRIHGYRMYDRHGEEIDSCYGFIGDDVVGIQNYTGTLHDCEFDHLYEYVAAHKDDPDVLVAKYNETLDELNDMTVALKEMLKNIVDVKKLNVRFVDEQLVLEA